ncbi:MAG: DUF928 domain-containing protein [Synechococcales cyanobacterium RU_4_20]|nr:DUF928 domain-containing protein [Synechococcales cyanobacterium RU_4_20]NJR69420.1 DUF928 domain-containing protein [Synechococcales cyanobacterium CRU_2_2]
MKRPPAQKLLAQVLAGAILSLCLFNMVLAPLQASAASPAARNNTGRSAAPWKAPKQGIPGSREDGGTRAQAGGMSVLSPRNGVIALATAQPSLMTHLDASMASRNLKLLVTDESGGIQYEKTFKVAGKTGLFRLDLGDRGAGAMRANQDYTWFLSALPENPNSLNFDTSQNPTLSGKLRRLSPGECGSLSAETARRLAKAEPLQQARIVYEELGYWHESAAILSQVIADPKTSAAAKEEARRAWGQVMNQGGHPEFTQQMPIPSPLVEMKR